MTSELITGHTITSFLPPCPVHPVFAAPKCRCTVQFLETWNNQIAAIDETSLRLAYFRRSII